MNSYIYSNIPVYHYSYCYLVHCVLLMVYRRSFNTSLPSAGLFHEFDKKSGYKDKTKQRPTELIREGLKELKNEIRLWTSEVQDKLKCDPIIGVPLPGKI